MRKQHGPVPVSQEAIDAYNRGIGPCIEAIAVDMKKQARLAHYFRLGIKPPSR